MDKVKGKITKITNFGAFVAVEGGKVGMIHISEVSTDFVRDIHDFLSEGQNVEAGVISEDQSGRLALSIKRIARVENNNDRVMHERRAPQAQHASQKSDTPPATFYQQKSDDRSLEAMISHFKTVSDDKICDLNKSYDGKRGKNIKKPKR